jgi:hypothetical protein
MAASLPIIKPEMRYLPPLPAPVAPPLPPDIYTSLWSNPTTRLTIIRFLTELHANMQRHEPSVRSDVNQAKFYMKGGNAIGCLQHIYGVSHEPYFPSDFDYTILVSPTLSKADYDIKQANMIYICLQTIVDFLNDASFSEPFRPFVRDTDISGPSHIQIQDMEGIDPAHAKPNPKLNDLLSEFNKSLPLNCPFQLIVRTNTIFSGKLLNIGAIIIKLRNTESTELFDISFTLWNGDKTTETYNKIVRDWNMTQLIHYVYDTPLIYSRNSSFPSIRLEAMIYDPLTAYVNMRIAAKHNSRENKKRKRTYRANMLRNTILKPRPNIYTRRRNLVKYILKDTNVADVLNNI